MTKTILITGASRGYGALAARALADAGHTVYAGMRDIGGADAAPAENARRYAKDNQVQLRPLQLDLTSDSAVDCAVWTVLAEQNRLDVLVHNAEYVVTGPAEAFTSRQLTGLYDATVVGAQRINRAALPHMRYSGDGLVVWISSSRDRDLPYLAPYSAVKAGLEALAAGYALELAQWGIENTIVVPGSFTHDVHPETRASVPDDDAVLADYEERYGGLLAQIRGKVTALEPPDDAAALAQAIVTVVDTPKGERPFRVHLDVSDAKVALVNAVSDRIRTDFLHRVSPSGPRHAAASEVG